MIKLISNFFGALSGFFGWSRQRDAEANTAQMVAQKTAANEAAANDQVARDLAQKNLDALRKDVSE